MKTELLQPVLRKDYRQPDYWIETADLDFSLDEEWTTVRSRIQMVRNPAVNSGGRPLELHGEELTLRSVSVDGRPLGDGEYELFDEGLRILKLPDPADRFVVEIEVQIQPQRNTTLMGLYKTSGNFCTQCEAEGFRRITYFLDRPDVMARYTTRIEAARARYPVLLSNGNRVAGGELEGGRHWVKWEDPFPKPSYLFALVAGDLRCHRGDFVTRSGRGVELEIWVEPQNIDACEHAVRSLQKAMKWDEDEFGLEYDLDLYMIVAVNDFNMGAMENKGLNVFNSKYVLAKPETATDSDYESVEAVIAHEYFHNWTGNRVTCRDWFQLTLKEGLTVFRDQQFTADMTSAAVKRIDDVKALRAAQFAEDAGPMAHPIRPESYVEMNNFYTATVYQKGAEVVRMYFTLLGREGFRKGMDLYFQRHDNRAVECDDFRAAMADANGVDFTQFERWYLQAGTPVVTACGEHHEAAQTYTLQLSQSCRPTPELPDPQPFPIPIRVGLIGPDGNDMPLAFSPAAAAQSPDVIQFTEREQTITFTGVTQPPTPSLLRGFSAPVRLVMERRRDDLLFLLSHDSDSFNRWDAGQELAQQLLLELAGEQAGGRELALDDSFVEGFRKVLLDPELDGSLKALTLGLPSESWLGQQMEVIDVESLHAARGFMISNLARSLYDDLLGVYESLLDSGPYRNDKQSIDGRRLKNLALAYLTSLDRPETTSLALRQFQRADNMTDMQAALVCLASIEGPERDEVLQSFYDRWKEAPLVLDKWFAVQASATLPDTFDRVRTLAEHPDFTLSNPNRTRALLGALSRQNQVRFHAADGRPYAFLADKILELDPRNPQVAAYLVSSFNQWRRFDSTRQSLIKAQLERIASQSGLSKDVAEIVGRSLKS